MAQQKFATGMVDIDDNGCCKPCALFRAARRRAAA